MIQQCAVDIDETLSKSSGAYTGDALEIASKIVTGINYAYQKIAREKNVLILEESVTLDSDKRFSYSNLTKTVIRILDVLDSNDAHTDWQLLRKDTVTCNNLAEGDAVTVRYTFLPSKLSVSNLTEEPLLPLDKIDHLALCYYADFYVLSLEPDSASKEKAVMFLDLFNGEVDSIIPDFNPTFEIRMEPWGWGV